MTIKSKTPGKPFKKFNYTKKVEVIKPIEVVEVVETPKDIITIERLDTKEIKDTIIDLIGWLNYQYRIFNLGTTLEQLESSEKIGEKKIAEIFRTFGFKSMEDYFKYKNEVQSAANPKYQGKYKDVIENII